MQQGVQCSFKATLLHWQLHGVCMALYILLTDHSVTYVTYMGKTLTQHLPPSPSPHQDVLTDLSISLENVKIKEKPYDELDTQVHKVLPWTVQQVCSVAYFQGQFQASVHVCVVQLHSKHMSLLFCPVTGFCTYQHGKALVSEARLLLKDKSNRQSNHMSQI